MASRDPAHPGLDTRRSLRTRLQDYARLVRLDRPIGILLLLWPTLWALWIAGTGHPDPEVFVIFVAGVVLMRSAGCAFNDYADRAFDRHVQRTRDRPVATGRVAPWEAVAVAAVLAFVAFMLVVLRLDWLTIRLAIVGGFLAASYPFLKRWTSLPQFYLGAAFGWAVPMAFAAETGGVGLVAWLIFAAVMLWAVAYDTMYAMVDREDDLRIGIKSTAILFGRADRFVVGLCQLAVLALLLAAGARAGLGGWFVAGLVTAGALALWQQVLIRRRRPDDCFRAFLNNNAFGLAIFCGIALDYTFAGA